MSHESVKLTFSTQSSVEARSQLFELFKHYPASAEETERSMGLFLRGSLLARIFAVRELYEKIIMIPGIIVDLGTWRGQTAVLCENLRAILEPMHFNRRIVCFDTFTGYVGFSGKDKSTDLHKEGTYVVEPEYGNYLEQLLILHEKNNAMGHNFGKHRVIKGDCRNTVSDYFQEENNEIVSLAFFDLNSVDPTWESFKLIYEKLSPNGIIAFWQLSRKEIPAEGIVYSNNILAQLTKFNHTLYRSVFYPGLCYMIKG